MKIKFPFLIEEIFISEFTRRLLDKTIFESHRKQLFVIDKNVFAKYSKDLAILNLDNSEFMLVDPHQCKDLKNFSIIIQKMSDLSLTRKDCVVSVGGGSISDLVGFCASVYMRSIDFIQIPTTFMSSVDATMGKLAINFGKHKNLIGSFYSPRFVLINPDFLSNQAFAFYSPGLVEVFKHYLIRRNNNKLYRTLVEVLSKKNLSTGQLGYFIENSLLVKKYYVENDHQDTKGLHRALSMGHTIANYLETSTDIDHGAAVLYGIMFSALMSLRLSRIDIRNFDKIIRTAFMFDNLFENIDSASELLSSPAFFRSLLSDKISNGSDITLVIPTNNGFSIESKITQDDIRSCIVSFHELSSGINPNPK